tara:strand:+ start:800 stop:1135 length:336 start_codon:yes stop_codon:yes gene_type:complete
MGWVHVGTSNMTVARDLLTRAKKYPSKQVRFACTRYALKCHGDNIDTYRKAMSMEHGPKCWGYIETIQEDRNGEDICRCDKCGQMFYTGETNQEGHDVPVLREFDADWEVD